jgi:DNA polymerase I-like protein with 3'-5' exonuclease and polymerase domains
MLAHYMKDDDYTKEILEGDIHTANQKAAGLATRDQAKTFIYAFLYGAGNEKIGSIVGGSSRAGSNLKKKFLDGTPALRELRELVSEIAEKHKSLPGLDGRRLRVRHQHAALNTLLQGAGAIVMKKAAVIFSGLLESYGIDVKIVANVHDEWQVECEGHLAVAVGRLGCRAITLAGEAFDMRCPLAGDYHIGDTWAETH